MFPERVSRFRDRADAGRRLGDELSAYAGRDDVLVLGLPRGGVPVAWEVARELGAPLDVFLVRKLGVPGHPELAMGAIASGGVRVLNEDVLREITVPEDVIARVAAEEQRELERREAAYRTDRRRLDIRGRTVIVVDDGLATGATMRAAVAALKGMGAARRIVAVPVGAPATCRELAREVDEVVCLLRPEDFQAVGLWYEDFRQTDDDEVRDLLARGAGRSNGEPGREEVVRVPVGGGLELEGSLGIPDGARGIVLFAHGSGSSRHSPRNRFVAEALRQAGLATLLMDLLSAREEREDAVGGHLRFDIELLAERLVVATDWLNRTPQTAALRVGTFGASTGGGAALVAAADRPNAVGAVVSRGGRPDLAGDALPRVRAPTLLIVGGRDAPVLDLNRKALARLECEKRLEVVPGATHLFEEAGALEEVARLARDWFLRHLTGAGRGAGESQGP